MQQPTFPCVCIAASACTASAGLQTKTTLQSAVRKWLAVNTAGESLHLELAKLRVTHYLGVQLRDLRCGAVQLRQAALLQRSPAAVLPLLALAQCSGRAPGPAPLGRGSCRSLFASHTVVMSSPAGC